jgi:hypothetical protein
LIKRSQVDSRLINNKDVYTLSGITTDKTYTVGTVELDVFTEHRLLTSFMSLRMIFPPALLGKDFFGKFNTKIDFEDMTLSIAE